MSKINFDMCGCNCHYGIGMSTTHICCEEPHKLVMASLTAHQAEHRLYFLEGFVKGLEKRIKIDIAELEKQIIQMQSLQEAGCKKPYKCPICDGFGKDKNRLLPTNIKYYESIPPVCQMENPTCNSCKGKGIVWG